MMRSLMLRLSIACGVAVCGSHATIRAQSLEKINLEGLGRLPAFSHAAVFERLIFVSGTLGTGEGLKLVEGGVAAETSQALKNIERILKHLGATRRDIAKVNVFMADMTAFAQMNEAYLQFFGKDPPARTTIGAAALALGAAVEIECTAIRPQSKTTPHRPSLLPSPSRRKVGFIESDGEKIYYEKTGQGPAVVLTHGYGGNHAVWYQQVPEFAASYSVITWDARGFGRSTNHQDQAGPATSIEDLRTLLDQLGVKRAHLVGQSMGGWTVLGFALQYPKRVLSLTLADTIGGIYTPEIARQFDAFIARARASTPADGQFPLAHHPAIGRSLARRDPAQAFLYQQIASLAPPAPRSIPVKLRLTSYDHAPLKSLGVPVLFIVGAEDPIFPPQSIRLASQLVPGSKVAEIPEAGHSPYFERPAAWNRVLREFLDRVKP